MTLTQWKDGMMPPSKVYEMLLFHLEGMEYMDAATIDWLYDIQANRMLSPGVRQAAQVLLLALQEKEFDAVVENGD